MRRAPRAIAAFVLAAAAASCAPERAPEPAADRRAEPVDAAAIRTDSDRYVLRPGPHGPEATIVVTFTAPRDTTAYLLHCNGAIPWGLQRREGDRWTDAWVAMTNGCLSPAIVVPGGTTWTDTLVFASPAGAVIGAPADAALPPGVYRVAFHNVVTAFDLEPPSFGPEMALEHRVSAPITLVDPDF